LKTKDQAPGKILPGWLMKPGKIWARQDLRPGKILSLFRRFSTATSLTL
jgi:hypothetical protein